LHNIIVEKLSGVTCICDCVHSSSTPVFQMLSVLWILSSGWKYKNLKIWIFPFFRICWFYPTIHSIRYISKKKKVWNRLFTTTTISYFSDDKTLFTLFSKTWNVLSNSSHTVLILYDRVDEVHWRFRYYTIKSRGERNVIRTK